MVVEGIRYSNSKCFLLPNSCGHRKARYLSFPNITEYCNEMIEEYLSILDV